MSEARRVGVLCGVVPLDPAASDRSPSTFDTRSADGRWSVAFSGRLDNRDEVAACQAVRSGATDARLIADALAARGVSSLGDWIGDFAVAAWDSVERRLWLARDAIGFRPLFYYRLDDRVWFSTAMERIVSGPARGAAANDGFIAETLAGLIVSVEETPVDGVRRVLPAEALGFAMGERSPRREVLWRPPASLPARRPEDELIEEFRARFLDAVRSSIGADRAVSAQLSGGLDSTAVTAAAASMLGAPPDTYSLVYPSLPFVADGGLLDESPFIDAAVRAIGSRSTRFDPLGPNGLTRQDFLRVLSAHGELPDLPVTDALNFPLFTRAAADGHRVMLTGLGGDYWMSGSLSRLPWLIRRGAFMEAWRFARAARRTDTLEATWPSMRAHLLSRLSPGWAKTAYRRVSSPRLWPDWVPDAFAERVRLAGRLRRLSARVPEVDDEVLQDSLLRLTLSEGLLSRESLFRAAADAGIDVRHPMLDRRFIEFVITLPDDLRMRGIETRFIMRRALATLLPETIRERRVKGDASILTGIAIASVLAGSTPATPTRAAQRGWIDPSRLWPRLESIMNGDPRARVPEETDDVLWAAVAVEMWLANAGA